MYYVGSVLFVLLFDSWVGAVERVSRAVCGRIKLATTVSVSLVRLALLLQATYALQTSVPKKNTTTDMDLRFIPEYDGATQAVVIREARPALQITRCNGLGRYGSAATHWGSVRGISTTDWAGQRKQRKD